MIEFISRIGDGQVHHTASMDGRLLWEGSDPAALLETEEFALWPQAEAVQLHKYLEKHCDLQLTTTWRLSETSGVSEIAFVNEDGREFFGTIFSLFESSPLEQVLET
ncbi:MULTISPECIES: hypothetical protein [Rhizobium]|uniref:hypothetical protein n=1 Tax=Rhizobium TaxID=379 RepID=UPI0007EA4FAF|nr:MULTISPECIES: hypothetical protein [Rhizobium]ANL04643.1 hypothetical protein AMJ99_CH03121 [Rhizobium esperanzae]ANM35488.1 hypothetical protein AMK04_CH03125 [Rhizobium sp. N871]